VTDDDPDHWARPGALGLSDDSNWARLDVLRWAMVPVVAHAIRRGALPASAEPMVRLAERFVADHPAGGAGIRSTASASPPKSAEA
jgi:hypothetical protein